MLKDNKDLSNIYQNNLWLLDDKYMTYNTAMSNKSMKEIVEEISQNISNEQDRKTPDLAVIFSDSPTNSTLTD